MSRSIVLALFLLIAQPLIAAELTRCDQLAVNPLDPDRVTEGVPRERIDLPHAISACREAHERHPAEPRFAYQLARVLFYQGEVSEALHYFRRAAGQDYRQASFLLGLIMTRGYPDVERDDCAVAAHWLEASRQGHPNAQLSYVRDRLDGRFDRCAGQAGASAMRSFLDEAAEEVGYPGGLLIEDLRERLDAPAR